MTIAFWCVLVAGLLPYVSTIAAKIGGERFDNRNPRDWLASQSGFRRRANAAQLNGFEAFPLFAAGVVIAHLAGAAPSRVDQLAIGFLVARALYTLFYFADMALLRSLAWSAGIACSAALFFIAA